MERRIVQNSRSTSIEVPGASTITIILLLKYMLVQESQFRYPQRSTSLEYVTYR